MTTETPQMHVEPISELAIVYPGYSPRREERKESGKYLLIGGRNIKDGRLVTTKKDAYIDDVPKESFRRAIAQPGDIIVSTLFDRRKLCIYHHTDPQAVVNNSCAIIRAPDNNDYIVSYLRTLKGQEQFLHDATEATGGAFIPRLSISDLSRIQVPLLPLSELQRLGDDHIRSSSTDDLIALRSDLQSKDAQIGELRDQLNALLGKDDEIERLRTELTQVTTYYEDRIRKIEAQISTNDLGSKIAHGETSKLEFKSSLRWNIKENRDDPTMELEVLKTIAAFCNTEGGEPLISVSDAHIIMGIEYDHFSNDDKFLLHLGNLIRDKLIPTVIGYIDHKIVTLDDKRICQVVCRRSKEGVWLKTEKNTSQAFYVRHGPSSVTLAPYEAVRYILEHFQK